MSVITHADIYCLYPHATLEVKAAILLSNGLSEAQAELSRAPSVREEILFIQQPLPGDPAFRRSRVRFLNDGLSWRISRRHQMAFSLPPASLRSMYTATNAFSTTSWTLSGTRDMVHVKFSVSRRHVFEQQYVTAHPGLIMAMKIFNAIHSSISSSSQASIKLWVLILISDTVEQGIP